MVASNTFLIGNKHLSNNKKFKDYWFKNCVTSHVGYQNYNAYRDKFTWNTRGLPSCNNIFGLIIYKVVEM